MLKRNVFRNTVYLVTAFFVTASDLYAYSQVPLNLELPKKDMRQYRAFGPGATPDSKISADELDRMKFRTQGEMLTVDTYDQSVCERIRYDLVNDVGIKSTDLDRENFCDSSKGRYVHVIKFDQPNERPALFSDESSTNLKDKVQDFTILGVGMMALLAAAPKSFTNWGDSPFNDPLKKWRKNVTSKPVVDKDDWAVNYVGHPYFGGSYYVVARKAGRSPIEAFGFSAFMSTFWWEYGLEALAEKPSIQDLIITPVVGAIFGEAMYQWNKQIEANGGKIYGSKFLGTMGLVLTDPAGSVMRGINSLTRNRFIYSSQINVGMIHRPREPWDPAASKKYELGLQLKMKFWGL